MPSYKPFSPTLAIAILCLAQGCAPEPHASPAPSPPLAADAPSAAPDERREPQYALRRTGGLLPQTVELTITADGRFNVSTIRGGGSPSVREGTLTREQPAELAEAFRGWADLKADYPAPRGAADAYQYEIRHAGKTVRASEAADLPDSLRRVIDALERIVSPPAPETRPVPGHAPGQQT